MQEIKQLNELMIAVCSANGIPVTALPKKDKSGMMPYLRAYFYFHAHIMLRYPITTVARVVCRHHASVLHGCSVYRDLLHCGNEKMLQVIENVNKYHATQQ